MIPPSVLISCQTTSRVWTFRFRERRLSHIKSLAQVKDETEGKGVAAHKVCENEHRQQAFRSRDAFLKRRSRTWVIPGRIPFLSSTVGVHHLFNFTHSCSPGFRHCLEFCSMLPCFVWCLGSLVNTRASSIASVLGWWGLELSRAGSL